MQRGVKGATRINHLLFNLLLAISLIGGGMEIPGLSNPTLSASSLLMPIDLHDGLTSTDVH
jgi:hypothetical protein